MKNLIFLLLSVIILCNKTSFAQIKRFSINTNLANLAAKGPSLSLEYKFSKKWSIQAYASKGEINIGNNYSYKTAILDFKHKIDKQLYTSTYFRYIEKDVYRPYVFHPVISLDNGRDFQGKGISMGQTIGYEVFRNKIYNLDLFAGAGYGGFIKQSGDRNRIGFLDLRIGILTGFNF
ncbi:DUF3575 domain-containing protein [Pedobacter cryophilus]|uniref:DUF3575 domain-containing protein n=1 Tax=Pedobacter cryophilus TaxID=2571271 RepID=A0A4U1C119_9SPHI|nr:DUF3575 domain-containing protein [Pedobacter cryophilus]TKB97780.1 DUF3575 domain-containing protein [Pedobacter cryophilus]